jgi:hypothetical protein
VISLERTAPAPQQSPAKGTVKFRRQQAKNSYYSGSSVQSSQVM